MLNVHVWTQFPGLSSLVHIDVPLGRIIPVSRIIPVVQNGVII